MGRQIAAVRGPLLSIALSALLAACGGGGGGGGGDDDHGHDDPVVETAGRLVISEHEERALRVHDLDDGAAVEATHRVEHVPTAVYASPQGRYAVVMQRLDNQVQFIDGGIWQEDHGDHLHDYKEDSRPQDWTLEGVRPTHYDVQPGVQAAVFMDGDATVTPTRSAGVRLIDDAGIAAGSLRASLDLEFPVHGLGEPTGDKLLTVSRADDAGDALPTHLELYLRDGDDYRLERQLPTRCDGMHGSYGSGSHVLMGCSDGMLLVRHTGDDAVDDGRKLATPLRVGSIAGHPRLPDHFIGIATEGTAPAPQTTRFYAVDAEAGSVGALVPQGWESGRLRRAHAFDRTGQRFYVLDDQGTLIVVERVGDSWETVARVMDAIPTMPEAAPWPAIVANGAKDEIYLTDPVARQLVVAAAADGAVQDRRDLGYTPTAMTWLGINR